MKNPEIERFVEFPNATGKILRGMLHLPSTPRRPAPAVVLFHGFTGDRMGRHWMFVKCSRALAQAGFASLRFDFYGSGESSGDFREMTLRGEIADGRAAVGFLRTQKEVDPARVGLLGMSMGGAVASALAHSTKARVLVLWSALGHTARLREVLMKAWKKIPGKPGAFEYDGREINPRFEEDLLKVEPIRHIARYTGPTLIVHPENDEIVPLSHAHSFLQAAGAPIKELAVIAGADHAYTAVPWEQAVIARTVDWFGRHL